MEQNERTEYQRGYDLALNSMANDNGWTRKITLTEA